MTLAATTGLDRWSPLRLAAVQNSAYRSAWPLLLKFPDIFKLQLVIEKTAGKSRNREDMLLEGGWQQSGSRCQPVCHSGRMWIII